MILTGVILEVPIRWIVHLDLSDLVPSNPLFNLPLRLIIEAGMIAVFIGFPLLMRVSLKTVGIPHRRWTRWEWTALAIVGFGELIVVIFFSGSRWLRIWSAGLMGEGLIWAFSGFMFGFNQETGFRGFMMTGLLRIRGWKWAFAINTLLFLIGPLHGPGILGWLGSNPGAAIGYAAGVIVNGLAFSWIRYRTDNVILVAILHGIINSFMNGSGWVLLAHN